MDPHDDLIHWKTQAWFDPGMVAWYSRQMQDQGGINALKYRVEQDILAAHVVGDTLLDVGVGTGRGSIPFARRGMRVTGVDSSQAMLDECRCQAGEAPMRLIQGDATRLPAEDGEYDTVMSLNLLVHLPHWQSVLVDWARVVKPGGRIVFDINSIDHFNAVQGRSDRYQDLIPDNREAFSGFMLALSTADIVDFASDNGLAVVDLIPYGGFASDSSMWPWRDGRLKQKHWWRRQVEWISQDPALFDFTLFLEHRLFAHLTTRVVGRFMAVLEKRADPAANRAWLAGREALNARLAGLVDAALLGEILPEHWTAWRASLNALLDHPRNRVLFGFLVQVLGERGIALALDGILDARHLDALRAWISHETNDTQAMIMASEWHACPVIAEVMTLRGVNLGAGLEYRMLQRLLRDYFGVFAAEPKP
jgi:2-polyprenyl-3-methyl-5-hydroxy-6-metoxy-1,4-benzoquinol methylase